MMKSNKVYKPSYPYHRKHIVQCSSSLCFLLVSLFHHPPPPCSSTCQHLIMTEEKSGCSWLRYLDEIDAKTHTSTYGTCYLFHPLAVSSAFFFFLCSPSLFLSPWKCRLAALLETFLEFAGTTSVVTPQGLHF